MVLTGYEDGIITLNISGADDSEQEAVRERMGEKYRSLVGRIRHELGHHYWDLLSRDNAWLKEFLQFLEMSSKTMILPCAIIMETELLRTGGSGISLPMLRATHGKIGQRHSATFSILRRD